MSTTRKTTEMLDRKIVLSTLWMFAVLNYLYADVMTLFFNPALQPDAWRELLSGHIGSIEITQGFALVVAILMETAIAMVLLSRLSKYGANRWANIIVGVLHTASVSWSLTGGDLNLFYAFFATIEISCTLFIVWYAWTWPNPEDELILRPEPQERRDASALMPTR